MKKVVIFSLAGILATLGCHANDIATTNSAQQICSQNREKMIWVEKNKICVPRDVCNKRHNGKYDEKYCIRDFSNVQVTSVSKAIAASGRYLKNRLEGFDVGYIICGEEIEGSGGMNHVLGQDYIPCTTGDGRYFVFEFDDTTNHRNSEPYEIFTILCKSMNGSAYRTEPLCKNTTESKCRSLREQMQDIGFFVSTSYQEVTRDCKFDLNYQIEGKTKQEIDTWLQQEDELPDQWHY